jgi:hypothetical protein
MTYAPTSISNVMKVWTSNGGVNSGIVGDSAHRARPSYHNGKDAIDEYDRTRSTDYSIRLDRDWNGLTNAASAMDLGKLDGSLTKLQAFSRWLVQRCKDRAPGTSDIREIIYSPDGKVVKRWDNHARRLYDGYPTATGQGDSSHLWHTHISFFRDSEKRDKTGLFLPYFTKEDDMPDIVKYLPGYTVKVKPTSNIRTSPFVQSGNIIRSLSAEETWTIVGTVTGGVDAESGSNVWYARWAGGRWEYTAFVNVTSGPTAPVGTAPADTTPFDQADIDAAVKAATDPLKSQVTSLQGQLTTIQGQVTNLQTQLSAAQTALADFTTLKTLLKRLLA